ncbi:hypothetical protein RvY_05659 [Ramazzottius varieornatus]|uniref:Uncharacterized protein n=1 Tax=Ramazzottius varieornatus TaxID=947166 RepID=A0A1D1V1E1_RAMVA|nr:hypothetical protein RvY_05659 [Ramazzottius varieornatus]
MALWEAEVTALRLSVQLSFGQSKTMKNTVLGENSRFGPYNWFVFSCTKADCIRNLGYVGRGSIRELLYIIDGISKV